MKSVDALLGLGERSDTIVAIVGMVCWSVGWAGLARSVQKRAGAIGSEHVHRAVEGGRIKVGDPTAVEALQTAYQQRGTAELDALDQPGNAGTVQGVEPGALNGTAAVGQVRRDQIVLTALLEDVAAQRHLIGDRVGLVGAGGKRRHGADSEIKDHRTLDLVGEHAVTALVADVELGDIVIGVSAGSELEVRGGHPARVERIIDVVDRKLVAFVQNHILVALPREGLHLHGAFAPRLVDAVVAGVEQGVDPLGAVALG
jgi:hypothetical protein